MSQDPIQVFQEAQNAATQCRAIAPETVALCRGMDVCTLPKERVFEILGNVLLSSAKPSAFFRALREMNHLQAFFPEIEQCANVPQSPVHHPEGDVFEHTMLVLDCAAELRGRALYSLAFMLAALTHDLGKLIATEVHPDGKITAYGHETLGLDLCETALKRLTDDAEIIEYARNMMALHMRPNMLAGAKSKKKKTRQLFDLSVCPEDLILLSRADASGKLDAPYDPSNELWLRERLADYRRVLTWPMVTEQDLIEAGVKAGPELDACLQRSRALHFSGMDRHRALRQVLKEVHSMSFSQ